MRKVAVVEKRVMRYLLTKYQQIWSVLSVDDQHNTSSDTTEEERNEPAPSQQIIKPVTSIQHLSPSDYNTEEIYKFSRNTSSFFSRSI